ncbi:CAP domain-containing protein [Undibacterium sp. RTI2.1]|uniref:CAP domain-containing protein n=1 Tax=unclassified Undibacterium TaxID=2630295 RepID=UPI002B23D622|nr:MULTISPECIES: CAP domain-containing protein [unclassified Undibacterium]MEB0032971.1 CAP domain-containing protein [Undibacterium sp. RTI2.1]MEB0118730.1 CAP domain-containing protein [Undibacterium sp. RTI2.2]
MTQSSSRFSPSAATRSLLSLSVLATVAGLSACGGGGSGSSTPTTPVVSTCSNGGTDYPTCTAPVTAAQLQLTVPAPPYAVGSEELNAFNYLNNFRQSLGLGLLAYSPELTLSTKNHANYLVLNRVGGFDEDPTKPGFTGVTIYDRASFAGYATNYRVTGGQGISNTLSGVIQGLIDSVYHREILMLQDIADVGMTRYCFGICDNTSAITLAAAEKKYPGQRNASDFVMTYPLDKQTNVDLSARNETTNPFPDFTDGVIHGKVGYPVSFVIEASQTLVLKDFTMTEAATGIALNAYVYTAANDPNKLIQKNEAWLTSKTKLKPSTTYNMVLHGSVNGNDITCVGGKIVTGKTPGCSWSFTTAAGDIPSF